MAVKITDDQLERAIELITYILADLDESLRKNDYRDTRLEQLIELNLEIKENK